MIYHNKIKNCRKLISDCKLASEALGIASAAATYPCPFCETPRGLFADKNYVYGGGRLRSYKRIVHLAKQYEEHLAKFKGKNKPSSAEFFNCKNEPLIVPLASEDGADTFIIDVLAPMVCYATKTFTFFQLKNNSLKELHILLGLVHYLYDRLEKLMELLGSSVNIKEWPHQLGFTRSAYWGSFDGIKRSLYL